EPRTFWAPSVRLLNGADFCAIAFPSAEELLKAFLAVSYGSGIDRFQAIKKDGEVVLPGFGKLVRQRRKDRTGVNPKTQQKIKFQLRRSSNSESPTWQRTQMTTTLLLYWD
ncbi:MAG TPA: HU family DNA-binding protein, partial [Chthoniobacterales bacterium]|nr:HU family DNA-binding protein [Chthoniobacterales bacterium]